MIVEINLEESSHLINTDELAFVSKLNEDNVYSLHLVFKNRKELLLCSETEQNRDSDYVSIKKALL